ncbi:acyl-homoserine-lactone synthase [Aeromonas dhakensis]|uniref:acyl-homoserine-lactone synthase n=1 Tax=Aeromonas dhakensis TaxID=196024 RepID=UPI001BCA821E|nr:acyl-homoserine-lactone synthase [Aeromonas dhakensis]MBS4718241.1 GNAT family N-acetyltransferase [Aeromonas dhakensis]MDX7698169.1 acyl-homoserine-lactone synthase [Aeromonas dhakensis]HDZ8879036.1 GNAT family N-acetyltransferase [Aeromonas dhakensis]
MHIITGTTASLGHALSSQMFEYRYRVFVETLGWELDCTYGVEKDQFDREDTVYVIALKANGMFVGVARLLNTTHPYLLGNVFTQLLADQPVPCEPDVWELSRFAMMDFDKPACTRSQIDSLTVMPLLRATLNCAADLGARGLVTVSPLGVERLLRRYGAFAKRLGQPAIVNGYALIACWIECTAQLSIDNALSNAVA